MISTKKIIQKLISQNLSIAVAESCTGGLISHSITKLSGASNIFTGGIVCYSNESKIKYLSVPKNILKKHGAVSPNVAKEMIDGLFKKEKTKICVSTTGIAGPKGGTKNKPVGLVFIGIKFKKSKFIYKKFFKGTRLQIQKKTNEFVFKKLNELI